MTLKCQLHHVNIWDDGMRYGLGIPFLVSYAQTHADIVDSWELCWENWQAGGPVSEDGIVGGRRTPSAEEIAANILAASPDLVGFTMVAWSEKLFLRAIEIVKRQRPDILVAVGGPMATDCGPPLVGDVPVDFLARGYAERGFVALLRALRDGDVSELPEVPGMYVRTADGWVGRPSDGSGAGILPDVPSVFRNDLVDVSDCKKVHVEWSRGCPIGCTYCSWGNGNLKVHIAPKHRIVDDIRWAKERGFTEIVLNCSAINFTTGKLRQYIEAMEEGDPEGELTYTAFIMYETLKPEHIELFKRVNFRALNMGLQTDEALGRKVVGRPPFDKARFEYAVSEIAKFARPGISIISGIPGDTSEKFQARIDYLLDVLDGDITVFPLQASPGTMMWNRQKELGIEPDEDRQYWVYETPSMTARDHLECLKFAARRLSGSRHHVRGFERDSHGICATNDFFEGIRQRMRGDRKLVQLHHTNVYDGGVSVGLGVPFLISHARRRPTVNRHFALSQVTWTMHYPGRRDTVVSQVVRAVVEDPPVVVGFTLQAWNVDLFLKSIRQIKANNPDIIVVVGGPSVTDMQQAVLEAEPAIDFAFLGFAEQSFSDWLEALADERPQLRKTRFGGISGLLYRDEHGTVVRTTAPFQPLTELDPVGAPVQDGLVPAVTSLDILNVEWTRGCPVACTFCGWPMGQRKLTHFSEEYIARDIEWALQHGFQEILICDAAINFNTKWMTKLVQTIEEADPEQRIAFDAFLQYYAMNETQAGLLPRVRWKRLMTGLQTDCPDGLKALHRPKFDPRVFEQALDWIRPAQQPIVDIITAVPFDTPDKIRRRVEYLLGLDCRVTIFPLLALPGTEIWKQREAHGFEIRSDQMYAVRSLPTMSEADYLDVLAWVHSLEATHPIEMVGYQAFGYGRSWEGEQDVPEPEANTLHDVTRERLVEWLAEVVDRYRLVSDGQKQRLGISGWTPYNEIDAIKHADSTAVRVHFSRGDQQVTIDAFDLNMLGSPVAKGQRMAFLGHGNGPSRMLCKVLARLDVVGRP